MKVKVQTLDGAQKAGGDIELKDEIFGLEPRADILHRGTYSSAVSRPSGSRKS